MSDVSLEGSSQSLFPVISAAPLLLLYIYVTLFVALLWSFDTVSPSPRSFFSFLFSFGDFYWDILKLRDSPLSHVRSTNEPIKSILHYPYSVFDLWYFFWFFRRISIFLFTSPIGPCMLSTLSIRALSVLIIVVLNSCFGHFNILAIFEAGFDAHSVSSNCGVFFCLLLYAL